MKNWKKYFLPPVLIYVTIFMFISFLIGLKQDQTAMWVWLVGLVITVVGLYMATDYVKPKSEKEILNYSFVWLAVFVILDLLLTMPFTGPGYFNDLRSYIPYVLTLLLPVLIFKRR